MEYKAKIKEIFTSIQGEGPYIGFKQLFIRFCGCNLYCDFCDTAHFQDETSDSDFLDISNFELKEKVMEFDFKTIHSISLTGGEPLLWADFLSEFLPLLDCKIYLETNSILGENLSKIIDYVQIISADIKLPSATGIENSFAYHDEFFKIAAKGKAEIFAKIVFDENILENEILNCIKLAEKYNLQLILQPKMNGDKLSLSGDKILEIFNKFLYYWPNTRVIPQVHKFIDVI